MLVSVSFIKPINAEPFAGGTEEWSVLKHGPDSAFPVTCEDKGTHILLTWTAKGVSKYAGRKCRIKVPLTNIAQAFEVEDEVAGKEKAK